MKKVEFLNQMNTFGISLNSMNIFLEKQNAPFSTGVFMDKGSWIVYTIDERNNYSEAFKGEEELVFDLLSSIVFSQIKDLNYTSEAITEELIRIPKSVVFDFLRDKYDMTNKQSEKIWDYLKQDFSVLNEFKYYIVNEQFVPEKYCIKVQGYSAEQVCNMTYLKPLGAFNYLIYLKKNPKEALANLKNGLMKKEGD